MNLETAEELLCLPGTMKRTPHNHELCMRHWPAEAVAAWEAATEQPTRYATGVTGDPDVADWHHGHGIEGWGHTHMRSTGTELKWRRLTEKAKQPRIGYIGDAGIDLAAVTTVPVPVGQTKRVDLDIAIQLPEGVGCLMMGRSSTIGQGLLVLQTLIDPGYRGELFCMVHNLSQWSRIVQAGNYLAQLVPFEAIASRMVLTEVAKLDESARGTNGFGSTGMGVG